MMKICHDHWYEIRNAIRKRGLWKLVSQAGYAAQNLPEEPGTQAVWSAFDPLIVESSMISEQAFLALGSPLTSSKECPLCQVEQNFGSETVLEWIDDDADTILQLCRDLRLVTSEER